MKTLVTGGAGYIGSHTCKALAENGDEVFVYDNLSTGHRHFARWGDFGHGDINDIQKLRSCLREYKPDVVIHFAAFSSVGESVANPGKYLRNNVAGTLTLLEAMRDEGIANIVVSGSASVYGQPEKIPIDENTHPAPINTYGETKLIMEKMLADFHLAHGINWISLRYFNAAGASPQGEIGELHSPETHLIPRVIMATLGVIPPLKLFGQDYPTPDGTCIRDYIHVMDLASAHILAARHLLGGGNSEALNLGTGKGASVREIIKLSEKISGKKTPFVECERRAGDPAILVADATKAKKVLGWTAKKDLSDILTDAWNFNGARQDFFARN